MPLGFKYFSDTVLIQKTAYVRCRQHDSKLTTHN